MYAPRILEFDPCDACMIILTYLYGLQYPGCILCQKLVIFCFSLSHFYDLFWNGTMITNICIIWQFCGQSISFAPVSPPQNFLGPPSGRLWVTPADSGWLCRTLADLNWLWLTARVRQSQPESSKVIQSWQESARVSQNLPDSARVLERFLALADFLGALGVLEIV